jgi:hypothetical protein
MPIKVRQKPSAAVMIITKPPAGRADKDVGYAVYRVFTALSSFAASGEAA